MSAELNGLVTIELNGKAIVLPLLALKASDVLYAMATSTMKEGQTHTITLSNEEDSPFALNIFNKLARCYGWWTHHAWMIQKRSNLCSN